MPYLPLGALAGVATAVQDGRISGTRLLLALGRCVTVSQLQHNFHEYCYFRGYCILMGPIFHGTQNKYALHS